MDKKLEEIIEFLDSDTETLNIKEKNFSEILMTGMKLAEQISQIKNISIDEVCNKLWEKIESIDGINEIVNSLEEIENSFGDILDSEWEYFFVDNIWVRLDSEQQNKKFPQLYNHIKNNRKNENMYVSQQNKIYRLLYGTNPEVLRKNYSIKTLIDYEINTNNYMDNPYNYEDYFETLEEKLDYITYDIKDIIPKFFEDATSDKQFELIKLLDKSLLSKSILSDMYGLETILDTIKFLTPEVLEEKIDFFLEKIDRYTNDKNKEYIENELLYVQQYLDGKRELTTISTDNLKSKFLDVSLIPELSDRYMQTKLCTEYVLRKDKYALSNDDFISCLYQALKKNKLKLYGFDENQILELEEIFEKGIWIDEEPDMDKYEKNVQEFSEMNESDFEEFIIDLQKIKNIAGKIPEKYCDYLIKQKLDLNSNMNKNLEKFFPIFKRSFEDKTDYILQSNNVEKQYIIYIGKLKELGAIENDEKINFLESSLFELNENDIFMINALFHECKHAEQHMHVQENLFPHNAREYIITKEKIIKEIEPSFYENNYTDMFEEIEARTIGVTRGRKYLQKIGINAKKNTKESYESQILNDVDRYNLNRYTRLDFEHKDRNLNEIFIEILKKDLSILKKYPVLLYEFNENGERKSRVEVLKRYEDAIKKVKINKESAETNGIKFFPTILKNHGGLKNSTYMKEIEQLQNYEPYNKVMEKYIDDIIEYGALQLFDKSKENKKIELSENETEKQKEENFNILLNRLNSFVENHPNQNINAKIKQSIKPFIEQKVNKDIQELQDIIEDVDVVMEREGDIIIGNIQRKENNKEVKEFENDVGHDMN